MTSGKLLGLLLMLLPACSPSWMPSPVNGTWNAPSKAYVCIDLPPEQYREAAQAVRIWGRALRQWKDLVPEHDEPCIYHIHESLTPYEHNHAALAWVNEYGGTDISLYKGHYENDTLGIVLHEMGHALGAQHVPGTLMNPGWRKGQTCPDFITVAQVAAYNKINLELLGWCY